MKGGINKMEEYENQISDIGQMGTLVESCLEIPLEKTHLEKIQKIKGLENCITNFPELSNYEKKGKRYLYKDYTGLAEKTYFKNQLVDIDIDEKHQIAAFLIENYQKDECLAVKDYDESQNFAIHVFNKGKLQSSERFTSLLRHWFESREPYEFNEANQDLNKVKISQESEKNQIVVNASGKDNGRDYKVLFSEFASPQERYLFKEKGKLVEGKIKNPEYGKIMTFNGNIR